MPFCPLAPIAHRALCRVVCAAGREWPELRAGEGWGGVFFFSLALSALRLKSHRHSHSPRPRPIRAPLLQHSRGQGRGGGPGAAQGPLLRGRGAVGVPGQHHRGHWRAVSRVLQPLPSSAGCHCCCSGLCHPSSGRGSLSLCLWHALHLSLPPVPQGARGPAHLHLRPHHHGSRRGERLPRATLCARGGH